MATKQDDLRASLVTTWGDHVRYECPFCGWDTLDEAAMGDHLHPQRGRHPDFGSAAPPDTATAMTKAERDELAALRVEVAALRKAAAPPQRGKGKGEQTADGGGGMIDGPTNPA